MYVFASYACICAQLHTESMPSDYTTSKLVEDTNGFGSDRQWHSLNRKCVIPCWQGVHTFVMFNRCNDKCVIRFAIMHLWSCVAACRIQPFTYNTRISPFTGIYTNIRRHGAPGFTTSLPLVTLPNAQYTVCGMDESHLHSFETYNGACQWYHQCSRLAS
jgi:hypothetical protein